MEKQKKAMLYGLISVLFWSTVATAFSISLTYFIPVQLLIIAVTTSFVCLLLLTAQQGKMSELYTVAKYSWRESVLFGVINPFIYYLVLLEAYRLLPAQEAQSINYTWAIMLSFLAVPILKQKLSLADIAAAVFCYFGVLVISTQGEPTSLTFTNLVGVSFALLSTIIWAFYWLLCTKDSRPSLIGLTLNFAFSLPFLLIYFFITTDDLIWPIEGVLSAVYIGVFEMGVTFFLWNTALKLTDKATKIANLIFLAPILSIIWISQLTDEVIRFSTVVGLGLILIGLAVQNWMKKKAS